MGQLGMKGWALTLAVAATLAGAAVHNGVAAEDMDIAAKIEAAKTPADHEAIAAYYEGEAAEMRAKVEMHRKMGADYKKLPHNNKIHFDQHCDSLSRNFTAAAKEYDALAKAHHEMAKAAK